MAHRTGEKHGLKVNKEKTEVMWVGQVRKDMGIKIGGKELKQVRSFTYLGGAVTENGRVEAEITKRIQAGANAFRKVEGVMIDGKITRKLKGKVLNTCVIPAAV